MSHFAKLDSENIVIDVNVVSNDVINNLPFPESEAIGIAFLTEWSNGYTNWKQTSYNRNFRANYAGIGYVYDATNDVFYAPQPYPSWTISAPNWIWTPPTPRPDGEYYWDETTQTWIAR